MCIYLYSNTVQLNCDEELGSFLCYKSLFNGVLLLYNFSLLNETSENNSKCISL